MIDYGLKDKVVIITGTYNSQGIGAVTALAFTGEGVLEHDLPKLTKNKY